MRPTLLATILLSLLLAACAANREQHPAKRIPQSETLKVHPGLLGQPVPPELEQAPGAKPAN